MNKIERLHDERLVLSHLGFKDFEVDQALRYSSLCWGPASRGECLSIAQNQRYLELSTRHSLTRGEREDLDNLLILSWSSSLLAEIGRLPFLVQRANVH